MAKRIQPATDGSGGPVKIQVPKVPPGPIGPQVSGMPAPGPTPTPGGAPYEQHFTFAPERPPPGGDPHGPLSNPTGFSGEVIPPSQPKAPNRRPIEGTFRNVAPPNAAGHVEVAGPASVAPEPPRAEPNFRLPNRPIGALPAPPPQVRSATMISSPLPARPAPAAPARPPYPPVPPAIPRGAPATGPFTLPGDIHPPPVRSASIISSPLPVRPTPAATVRPPYPPVPPAIPRGTPATGPFTLPGATHPAPAQPIALPGGPMASTVPQVVSAPHADLPLGRQGKGIFKAGEMAQVTPGGFPGPPGAPRRTTPGYRGASVVGGNPIPPATSPSPVPRPAPAGAIVGAERPTGPMGASWKYGNVPASPPVFPPNVDTSTAGSRGPAPEGPMGAKVTPIGTTPQPGPVTPGYRGANVVGGRAVQPTDTSALVARSPATRLTETRPLSVPSVGPGAGHQLTSVLRQPASVPPNAFHPGAPFEVPYTDLKLHAGTTPMTSRAPGIPSPSPAPAKPPLSAGSSPVTSRAPSIPTPGPRPAAAPTAATTAAPSPPPRAQSAATGIPPGVHTGTAPTPPSPMVGPPNPGAGYKGANVVGGRPSSLVGPGPAGPKFGRATPPLPPPTPPPTATGYAGQAARGVAGAVAGSGGAANRAAGKAIQTGIGATRSAAGGFRASLPALALQAIAHPESAAWAAGHPVEAVQSVVGGVIDGFKGLADGRFRAGLNRLASGDANAWHQVNEQANPVMWGAMAGKTLGEEGAHAIKGDGTLPGRLYAAFNAPAAEAPQPEAPAGPTAAEMNESLKGINAQVAQRDAPWPSTENLPPSPGGKGPVAATPPRAADLNAQYAKQGIGGAPAPTVPRDRVAESMQRAHNYLVKSGPVGQGESMDDLRRQYHTNVLASGKGISDYQSARQQDAESRANAAFNMERARNPVEKAEEIARSPAAHEQFMVGEKVNPALMPAISARNRQAIGGNSVSPTVINQANYQDELRNNPNYENLRPHLLPGENGQAVPMDQILDHVENFPGVKEGNPNVHALIRHAVRGMYPGAALEQAGSGLAQGMVSRMLGGDGGHGARRRQLGAQLGLWKYQ